MKEHNGSNQMKEHSGSKLSAFNGIFKCKFAVDEKDWALW